MERPKMHGYFVIEHKDRNGNVIWRDEGYNNLADEGEQAMLDVFFRNGNAPTAFALALFNDTPVDTDTVSSLTGEPAATYGYARQALARNTTDFPALALDSGDYMVTSKVCTFSASGGSWGPVTYAVLIATIDSAAKLIAYKALSQSRTIADGESIDVTYKLKLS